MTTRRTDWTVAAALAFGAAKAGASQWSAGAAVEDITPPAFDAAADAAAFPDCPSGMTGPRAFAFEEPYVDVDASGDFTYGIDTYCDANRNGRWDGIFSTGGVDHQAQVVHDALEARAIALSDGTTTVVMESIVAQGLFIDVADRIRARAQQLRPGINDVLVSANHNESSPDTIGIYGAPSIGGSFGGHSGIDDYYVDYLVEQAAQAAAAAYDELQPATLWAQKTVLPSTLGIHLSVNFPTTDDNGNPVAIDDRIGVLQAQAANGQPIFTVLNVAAHNQEIGHSDLHAHELSSDWPGYFERSLEGRIPGMVMYVVGDNGSQEDPQTVPPVASDPGNDCPDGCYEQAQATGEAFADAVQSLLPQLQVLASGTLKVRRQDLFVPIENNLLHGASLIGLFAGRTTYDERGNPAGSHGSQLKTRVSVMDVGPDLQWIANPGEAFPALMIGSRWGIEDASCPDRDNPPVPTWHARAPFRFQLGLADDFMGYQIPAWAFSAELGVFNSSCHNDKDDKDAKGHPHKLEDEGLGPTESNAMAAALAALLDQEPDPVASIRPGRYVYADGTTGHDPLSAIGIWVGDAGATSLDGSAGRVVLVEGHDQFGKRNADAHGVFMDFDGRPLAAPDLSTRGMLVTDAQGQVTARYYVDGYPALTVGTPANPPPAAAGGAMGVDELLLLAALALRRWRKASATPARTAWASTCR